MITFDWPHNEVFSGIPYEEDARKKAARFGFILEEVDDKIILSRHPGQIWGSITTDTWEEMFSALWVHTMGHVDGIEWLTSVMSGE